MKQHQEIHTENGVLTEETLLSCRSSRSSATEMLAFLVGWAKSEGKSSVSSSIFSTCSAIIVSIALAGRIPDETSCSPAYKFSLFTPDRIELNPRIENLSLFSHLLPASVPKRRTVHIRYMPGKVMQENITCQSSRLFTRNIRIYIICNMGDAVIYFCLLQQIVARHYEHEDPCAHGLAHQLLPELHPRWLIYHGPPFCYPSLSFL